MLARLSSLLGCGVIATLLAASLSAQQTVVPEEVGRYHEMLRKRPQFGVVFDRFTDAWLAERTSDELRDFLIAAAAKPDASAADHVLLGLFHTRQGNETEALAAFSKALQLAPDNGLAWQERARLEMRMLDFDAALRSLDAALAQHPEAKLALDLAKLRGRVLLRTGKPEAALQAWRDLLAANPDDEDLAEELVDVQLDEGLTAEAAATLQALIARTDDAYTKVSRKLWLSDLFLRAGNKAETLKALGECLEQSGRDTWIEGETLARIERVYRREDNVAGLNAHLATLAAADESRIAVHQRLARVQAETGDKDKALATSAAILARTPGRRDLRESYLDLLERFEKFGDAITQTKLLIEQNPGDKELQLRLAGVLQRSGDPKAADAALASYLAAKGTVEFDHLRVARLLEQWERPQDAKAAFARLVAAFPESESARDSQAQFLHRSGDKEAALAIWRDLAAKGDLEELLAVAQALLARSEAKTALEVLQIRHAEFAQESRFLTPLITAAHSVKEDKAAVPWVLDRVRLSQDAASIDDALRQAEAVLRGAEAEAATLATLKAKATLPFPERALLAALQEAAGDREAAESTLRAAPPAEAVIGQARLVRLVESRQDWPRAATELEKLIAMPEGRTSQHLQRLVDLRQRAGEPEAALKLIADWKTLSPGAVQPWLTESALLSQLGKSKEAVQVLRAASRKFEDDDNVAAALANAYADLGQFSDAEAIFMRLVDDAAGAEDKLRWVAALAQAAQVRGKLKDVTETFQERQRTNRADPTPWLALARIYQLSDNAGEQLRCLREASRLRPEDVGLLHDIARVQEDSGSIQEAEQTLEQAAALDATTRSKQLIAIFQLRYGDEDAAFRTLFELFGGAQMETKDALKLADSMMAREQWDRAVAFLDPFVQRDPLDYRLRYLRAMAFQDDGKSTEAIAELVRIAAQEEELPEILQKKAGTAVSSITEYFAQIEKTHPPGMREVMEIVQNVHSARQHLYRRQQGGQVQSATSGVQLPPSVKDAQRYALVHLVFLSTDLKPEERDRLIQELVDAGWSQAGTLFALEYDPQQPWSVQMNEDQLRAHPGDELLHAVWLTSQNANGQSVVSVETGLQAYNLFKERYPQLALSAAQLILRADLQAGIPLLEEVLRKDFPWDESSLYGYDMSSVFLASLLGGGQQVDVQQKVDLPTPLRDLIRARLLEKVLKVPEKTSGNPGMNMMAVVYGANAFRADRAWESYIRLWDGFFEQLHKADPASRKALTTWPWQRGFSGNQPPALFAPLEFPPVCQALPAAFSMMMRYEDPWNPRVETGPEDDYAEVLPLLDQIHDPVLALVLAYKANQMPRVEAGLDALLKAEPPVPDAALLAAGFYSTQGNHARATELLVRCSAMPMDAAQRTALDAALVVSVTSLKDEERKALPEATLVAARQAARRFRGGRLSPEQIEELSGALAKLGLPEEAEQWKRLVAQAPAPVSTPSGSSYRSSPQPDKLEKLIAQKADEAAILREAAQQLRSIMSNYGTYNQDYARRQAKEMVDKLTFPEATKKLVEQLGQGTGEARRIESAGLIALIGENGPAVAILKSVLEANPRQAQARGQLLVLTAMTDPDLAVKMVSEVPWETFAKGAGMDLAAQLHERDSLAHEPAMKLLEALAQYLERLASGTPPPSGALEWARHLPLDAAQYDNKLSLGSLYQRDTQEDSKLPAVQRRRQVHEAVCRAVMKHPSIAAEGFRGLAGLAIHEKTDLAEFGPLAERLLREARTAKESKQVYRGAVGQWRWGTSRESEFWRPLPAEFLVWHAWKNGHPERIEAEILPLASAALPATELKALRAFADLWTSAPDGFTAAAAGYLKTGVTVNRGNSDAATDVVLSWNERKLAPDLLDAFLGTQLKTGDGNMGTVLSESVRMRAERGETEATLAISLAQITTLAIGPETGWERKMWDAADYRYGRYSGRRYDAVTYGLLNAMETMLRNPKSAGAGLQIALRYGLLKHEGWREFSLRGGMERVAATPELALAFLAATPFLNEADGFETWGGGSSERDASPLIRLVSEIKERAAVRTAVRENLKQRQPRTFGVEVVEAMLDDNVPAALSTVLKRRASDLTRIPESRGQEIGNLISSLIPAVKQPATLDPALKKALEPLLAAQFKEAERRVESWMTATKLSQLKTTDRACETEAIRLIGELSLNDRAKAEAFFLQACKLIEAKEITESFDAQDCGNGWTIRSSILEDVLSAAPRMDTFGLSMKLYHEDTTGNLTMHGWSHKSGWGAPLLDIWRNAGGQGNHALGLQTVVERTGKELGTTPSTLLALAYYDFVTRLPSNLRAPAIRWAEEPSSDPALAPLRKELAMAGRLFLASDSVARVDPASQKAFEELGGLAGVWEHYLGRMRDEAINPRVRIALGHHLCYRAPRRVTQEIASVAAALALDAMKQRHCITGYSYAWILQAWCRDRTTVDDAWKAEAQAHWDAWVARCAWKPRSSSLQYRPADWAILNMLRVACRAGNEEWIARILSSFHESLSNEPSAFAVLVGSGRPKEAADWLEKNWKASIYDLESGLLWDADIAAGLPAFREACGSPDLAFLGESILLRLPDPPKQDQAGIPGYLDRGPRSAALALKLPPVAFTDGRMRTRCLELLAQEFVTFEPLAKEYDEAAAATDFAAILALRNSWEQWHQTMPLLASVSRKAWEGDFAPAIQAYEKILPSSRPYAARDLGGAPLHAAAWKWARTGRTDWSPMVPFVDLVLEKTPDKLLQSQIGAHISMKLLLHHAAGKPEAMAEWRKGLSAEKSQAMEKQYSDNNLLWNYLNSFSGVPKRTLSTERRTALVASLVQDEWVVRRYPDAGPTLPNLIAILLAQKVFTPDELPAVWKPIAEALPRRGRTASEAGDQLAQIGKLSEAAAALHLSASQVAEKDYGMAAGYLLREVEFLERLKHNKEALAIVNGIDRKRIAPAVATRVEQTTKRLTGQR